MVITVQKIMTDDPGSLAALIRIFCQAFDRDVQLPTNDKLTQILKNPNFIAFVAKLENKVVGGLTVHILENYYSNKPIAYIYDVAVQQEHQRKGIGKRLIKEVVSYCKANNFEEAYVEAEADDIEAINFYKSTQYDKTLDAKHFIYTSFNDH